MPRESQIFSFITIKCDIRKKKCKFIYKKPIFSALKLLTNYLVTKNYRKNAIDASINEIGTVELCTIQVTIINKLASGKTIKKKKKCKCNEFRIIILYF